MLVGPLGLVMEALGCGAFLEEVHTGGGFGEFVALLYPECTLCFHACLKSGHSASRHSCWLPCLPFSVDLPCFYLHCLIVGGDRHFLSFSYCPFVSIPLWDNYRCFYYSLFLRVIRFISISSFGDTSVYVCVWGVYQVSCFCIHVLHTLFLCFRLRERRIYDGSWIQKDQPHIVRTVW